MNTLQSNELILYDSLWGNLTILKIFGMYPIDGWSKKAFKMYAFFLYLILNIPVPILAVWAIVADGSKSISTDDTFADLFLVSQLIGEIVKYFPFKKSPQDIVKTIDWLKEDIFVKVHPDHSHILNDNARFSKRMFRFFFLNCTVAYAIYVLKNMGKKKFNLNIYLPFDAFSNGFMYHAINSLIDAVNLNGCFVNCAMDTMISALIWHAAGQIRLLKAELQDLVQHSLEELEDLEGDDIHDSNLKNTIIYKNMRNCIIHHNAIRQFVADLDKTYSIPVMSQLCTSVLVICFSLLQLSMIEPFSYMFYNVIIFLTAVLVEVLVFCYCGNLLFEESSTILQEISNTNWVELDDKSKNALIVFMENSKAPLMIRAGGLIDLSLETFLTIIRRSYSLLAVLNSYNA